ncbi:MAG: hypothetical protein ACQEXX_16730 [Bacillota bacterium]
MSTAALKQTSSGWMNYATAEAVLNRTLTGKQALYIVMKGSTTSSLPYIGNFDSFTWGYQKLRSDYADLELET